MRILSKLGKKGGFQIQEKKELDTLKEVVSGSNLESNEGDREEGYDGDIEEPTTPSFDQSPFFSPPFTMKDKNSHKHLNYQQCTHSHVPYHRKTGFLVLLLWVNNGDFIVIRSIPDDEAGPMWSLWEEVGGGGYAEHYQSSTHTAHCWGRCIFGS